MERRLTVGLCWRRGRCQGRRPRLSGGWCSVANAALPSAVVRWLSLLVVLGSAGRHEASWLGGRRRLRLGIRSRRR